MAEFSNDRLTHFLRKVVVDCVNVTDDHEADAMPQAGTSIDAQLKQAGYHRMTDAEKRVQAFDGIANRPLATELARSLQAQGLAAVGDVLNALERKSVSDLVDTWARMITVLRLDFVPMPLHVGAWGPKPWERLTASVVQALCHGNSLAATTKWVNADAAIRGWVRSHASGLARELHGETHVTMNDIIEDGLPDPERVSYLQKQIERYTAFASGVL